MEPAKETTPTTTPPPTERDPLGTRHKLSNLIMIAQGMEEEAANDPNLQLRIFAVKVTGMGLLAICDVVGSLVTEVRQWRDWSTRRPPKSAK
jgi:hypothetical protein